MVKEKWIIENIIDVATIYGRIGFRGYTKQDIVEPQLGAISLSPSNIRDNKIYYSPATYISWEKYEESPEIELENGDVVLVKTGSTLGKSAYVENLIWPTTLNPQIVVFKNIRMNKRLFAYYMAFSKMKKQINAAITGGAIPTLSQEQIYHFNIEYPIDEVGQSVIAEALSDIDNLMTSLQKLIDKKKVIKQGAMQELLTGKKRLPGFSGGWRKVKLGDCIIEQPSYGVNAPAERYNPVFPTYIRITDITEEGKFSHSDKASVIYNNYRNYLLKNHDIVLARTRASVGKSYLYDSRDGQLVYAGFLIKISINPQVANDKFVFYSLHTKKYWDWVGIVSMRSGQPGINSVEYASFEFELPPINEQTAIAQILTDMDNEIEQLEKKLAKYQQIRQGMMQELLTGHIRLIDDVEET